MAGKRKSYDDKFRASAVVMLQAAGYPDKKGALTYVAEHLKVPAMTISRWFNSRQNAPPNELVTEKKAELADLFEDAARAYLQHAVNPLVIEEVPGQAAMTAAAIATDKMQLLRGLPTSIVAVLPDLVKAMEAAGLNPSDVFNNMLARLHAQAGKVS